MAQRRIAVTHGPGGAPAGAAPACQDGGPERMRAVLVERHGPPEVLRVLRLPIPRPGPGQVLVRVHAAGVQPFDTYVRQGRPEFGFPLPHQLGNELAGVVIEPGPGVPTWSPGDEVFGWAPMRSIAEFAVADAEALARKPAALGWDQAGGLSASGQTALTALRALAVRPGQTLLVHAAAGGAGSMAVQLAVHRGIRVLGTASPANHAYLADLGATPLAYGPGLVERVRALAAGGVDAVLDAVGGRALTDSLDLVTDRRRIATLVDHPVAERLGVRGVRAERRPEQLTELAELAESGALRVTVRTRFPLAEIAQAHREVERGHGRGKVVIVSDGA